jgi:hypothetical protein
MCSNGIIQATAIATAATVERTMSPTAGCQG